MMREGQEAMVAHFLERCGHTIPPHPDIHAISPEKMVKLANEIGGELDELVEAIHEGDLTSIADALADIQYFAVNLAVQLGIPLHKVFKAVHESNMTKFDPKTGEPYRESNGRIMKGPYYEPPKIQEVLENTHRQF